MTLDGWDEIACHLEVISGVHRAPRTVMRYASLPDPLPIYVVNGQRKRGNRVYCEPAELEAWWRRQVARHLSPVTDGKA